MLASTTVVRAAREFGYSFNIKKEVSTLTPAGGTAKTLMPVGPFVLPLLTGHIRETVDSGHVVQPLSYDDHGFCPGSITEWYNKAHPQDPKREETMANDIALCDLYADAGVLSKAGDVLQVGGYTKASVADVFDDDLALRKEWKGKPFYFGDVLQTVVAKIVLDKIRSTGCSTSSKQVGDDTVIYVSNWVHCGSIPPPLGIIPGLFNVRPSNWEEEVAEALKDENGAIAGEGLVTSVPPKPDPKPATAADTNGKQKPVHASQKKALRRRSPSQASGASGQSEGEKALRRPWRDIMDGLKGVPAPTKHDIKVLVKQIRDFDASITTWASVCGFIKLNALAYKQLNTVVPLGDDVKTTTRVLEFINRKGRVKLRSLFDKISEFGGDEYVVRFVIAGRLISMLREEGGMITTVKRVNGN